MKQSWHVLQLHQIQHVLDAARRVEPEGLPQTAGLRLPSAVAVAVALALALALALLLP